MGTKRRKNQLLLQELNGGACVQGRAWGSFLVIEAAVQLKITTGKGGNKKQAGTEQEPK